MVRAVMETVEYIKYKMYNASREMETVRKNQNKKLDMN